MSATTVTRAIVGHEPKPDAPPGPNWNLEDVEVGTPGKNEVLVEMLATGVCHTDIVITSVPSGMMGVEYPKVAGHEGSGYVRAVGEGVTSVEVGDPVLLSFTSCQSCFQCKDSHPAYCHDFQPSQHQRRAGRLQIKVRGGIHGGFFGQSSFAAMSIVSETSVLNAKNLVQNDDELRLFSPLGCGLQTGAGAIINVAQAGPKDVVLVLGLGGVGMAAIMAAKIQGCATVIGVDRISQRLELAQHLGATQTLDTSAPHFNLNTAVRKISERGASVVVDTTGVPFLMDGGLEATAQHGKFIMIGIAPPGYQLKITPLEFLKTGISIVACIEGDAIPGEFIPKLVKWYREGSFSFDKLVSFLPTADFAKALHGMHDGSIIKPVLIW